MQFQMEAVNSYALMLREGMCAHVLMDSKQVAQAVSVSCTSIYNTISCGITDSVILACTYMYISCAEPFQ